MGKVDPDTSPLEKLGSMPGGAQSEFKFKGDRMHTGGQVLPLLSVKKQSPLPRVQTSVL